MRDQIATMLQHSATSADALHLPIDSVVLVIDSVHGIATPVGSSHSGAPASASASAGGYAGLRVAGRPGPGPGRERRAGGVGARRRRRDQLRRVAGAARIVCRIVEAGSIAWP